MQISITIDQVQPLTGAASASGQRTVSFYGWLELLRAIAELADAPGQSVDEGPEAGESPRVTQHVADRSL